MGLGLELRQVLAELELVSHVSAVNLNPGSRDSSETVGGKRPPGGVDGREDRHRREPGSKIEEERVLRSADYFRTQLERGVSEKRVLTEARASLAAWRRQPAPSGEPEYGTPQWKRWVAESELSSSVIAAKFNVSSQYIRRIRSQYRQEAA